MPMRFSFLQSNWPAGVILLSGVLVTVLADGWCRHEARERAQLVLEQKLNLQAQALENLVTLHSEVLRGLQNTLRIKPDLSSAQLLQMLKRQNVLIRYPGFSEILRFGAAAGQWPQTELFRADHIYPRKVSVDPHIATRSEVIRLLRQLTDPDRGGASPAFQLSDSLALHVLVAYPLDEGAIAILYRLEQLCGAQSGFNHFAQWRLTDRGDLAERGVPLARPVLCESAGTPRHADLYARTLINLPGRQWLIEAWAPLEPQASSALSNWLLLLGCFASLSLAALVLIQGYFRDRRRGADWNKHPLLRHDEERFHLMNAMLERNPDPVIIRNADGYIRYANPSASELLADDPRPLTERRDALMVSAELSEPPEILYCEVDRRQVHYEVMIVPLRDEGNVFTGTAMLACNRSRQYGELIRLAKELAQKEKLLALSAEFFWEQDETGRFSYVGGDFLNRYALAPQYFLGRTLRELGEGGLDEAAWRAHLRLCGDKKTFQDFEYVLRIDRRPVCLLLSGLPNLDAQGCFVGYCGTGRDISEIERSQSALLAERQRITSTLESISDGIITTDLHGRIDYLNPVASALTGWESADAMSLPIEQVLQVVEPQSRLPLVTLLRRTLETGHAPASHRCGILLNRFGLNFLIQEAVACVRNDQGEMIGAVLVFRDLTDWSAPREPGTG